MDRMEKFFDNMYRSTKGRRFSAEPRPYVKLIPRLQQYRKGLEALEIGAGEGQNSIFLAKAGYECTVTDISMEGLKRAKRYALMQKASMRFSKLDIRRDRIPRRYDLILMTLVLHNMNEKEREMSIKKIAMATNKHGINFVSFYNERDGIREFGDIDNTIVGIYEKAGFRVVKKFRYKSGLQSGKPCIITALVLMKR